jgi:hypothetical protein
MLSGELDMQMRLATIVAPVAVYFLILGILNSRRHPQLITGRQDIVLLVAALSPLLVFPLSDYIGGRVAAVLSAALAGVAIWSLLRGSAGGSYVIYNYTREQASQAMERALQKLGVFYQCQGSRLVLSERQGEFEISSFSLLRNVSIRMRQVSPALATQVGAELGGILRKTEAQTSSMAMGLLIVAMAMLVAPMVTVAHRAPEIVRILTDLLH